MYNLTLYNKLLNYLRKNYLFIFFNSRVKDNDKPLAIIRHDIDYSLDYALKMADLESSAGIKTTYLIMASSPFYNIFEDGNRDKISKIIRLGHKVGLHFYASPKLILRKNVIIRNIEDEFRLIKKCIPNAEPIVSWHNPSLKLIREVDLANLPFINIYNKKFTREWLYISDSNYRYTFHQLIELLKQYQNRYLHLLIHPAIWILQKKSMEETLAAIFIETCRKIERKFTMNNIWKKKFSLGFPREFYKRMEDELSRLIRQRELL